MNRFAYTRPGSLREVSATLRNLDGRGRVIAGGTALLPALKQGLLRPEVLADLSSIREITGLDETESGELRIGAATPLSQVAASSLLGAAYPALAKAAGGVASLQIRNRATIGGNLCLDTRCWYYNQSAFWRKSYPDCRKADGNTCYVVKGGSRCYALMSSDLAPALIALDAKVETFNSGDIRIEPIEKLFTGDGANPLHLHPGDVLTHLTLPKRERPLLAFRKFSFHPPVNFGLITLAVAISSEPQTALIQKAKLVLGGVDSAPVRCLRVEDSLAGMPLESLDPEEIGSGASKEVTVYSNVYADQGYKKEAIRWLVSQTLTELLSRPQTTEGC